MSEEDSLPASICGGGGGGRPSGSDTSLTDPALVRLYEALKGLDKAIYDALRALDVALGRDPSTGPPEGLPFRELGRLKNQLEAATGAGSDARRLALDEIALEVREEPDADADRPQAGVTPKGD